MRGYVVQRLLLVPVTLIIVSMAVFTVLRILPGDVAHVILGQGGDATYSEEQYRELRDELGLNRNLGTQYVAWVSDLATLDLGTSYRTHVPVASEIRSRLPITLELAAAAWLMSVLVGITFGAIMASYHNRWPDQVLRLICIAGLATPPYWLGAVILALLASKFGWNPPIGSDPWEGLRTNFELFVLPVLAISFYFIGFISRLTRSALLEVLGEDYIRTAVAKGVPRGLLIRRHALKNAMIPVLTLAGYQFGNLLGGALVIELVFGLPGLGRLLFDAVISRDYPVVQASIMLTAVFFMLSNLAVDLSYSLIDPRVRRDAS